MADNGTWGRPDAGLLPRTRPAGHECRAVVAAPDADLAERLVAAVRESGADWRAEPATDCYAAGQLVGTWNPDVLVLDTDLPGVDAYRLCRRLTCRPGGRLAVILLGRDRSPQHAARAEAFGAAAYLAKPPALDRLTGLLRVIASAACHTCEPAGAR